MENSLRANPLDVRELYEKQLKNLQEAYGAEMLESRAQKITVPAGRGRQMIETIRQGLKDDGFAVSINELCRWFEVPRRAVFTVLPANSQCRKIDSSPDQTDDRRESFLWISNRHILLKFNKNTVQRCSAFSS